MKAVFCDIDGVLNHLHDKSRDWTQQERFSLAPDLVANLRKLMDAVPDAKLVISSSWRNFHDNMGVLATEGDWRDTLAEMLGIPRDRIEDAPTLHEFGPDGVNGAKGRAHDILLWLGGNGNGDPYVVLDDECTELRRWLGGCVVNCADGVPHGLTPERVERAIHILQGKTVPSKPRQPACCGGGGC